MYSYTFDEETGGILLNSSPTNFSKEPRPVYSFEMDLLGFSAYWKYDHQNETPYMWVESNTYWYKGQPIARIKGGDLYHEPILTPITDDSGKTLFGKETGHILEVVDIPTMCAKNRDLLALMENTTVKLIVKEYEKYKNKLDIFHVAFSGGKDSAVLLDLVKKALPKGSFVVIFGDTGMEFPDTYDVVEYTKRQCEEDGTPFYVARSHFNPEESWKLFGPPARVLRWCCSVHKSTPQTIKMREITGKNNYTGMDFVGVRGHESTTRSKYNFENFDKKQKGQYSFYPILEWTSAEVWLYIFANHIFINEAYKKGNSRAGCLMCPMSNHVNDFVKHCVYPKEIEKYIELISVASSIELKSATEVERYILSESWMGRRSGKNIRNNQVRYRETALDGKLLIDLLNPLNAWEEWIKTVNLDGVEYSFSTLENGYRFVFREDYFKLNPTNGKYIRQALKKAAYCVGCRVCEINCKFDKIRFNGAGKVQITDCLRCHKCHDIPSGCFAYNSLKISQGDKEVKNINCFDGHAPKRSWLVEFFDLRDDFFEGNTLGPNMLASFKRFLRDAELISNNKCTTFTKLIVDLGWDTPTALGLMLINLVYKNAQIEWYFNNLDVGLYYEIKTLRDLLESIDLPNQAPNFIINAYKRLCDTPFGTNLNFGFIADADMVRSKWIIEDNRVVLYGLYKFMEKCNYDFEKEFHLSYLYDEETERDGVSPVRMFGIYDEEEWKSILLGLSARYPEFINATFTNDLKTISLKNKTSADVLELFREDI